jgi:hypothetical protein
MKLRGLVPNSYIHVFLSNLYIPRIRLPIQQNRQTDPGNIKIAHRYMNGNWERGRADSFWEHINRIFFVVYIVVVHR